MSRRDFVRILVIGAGVGLLIQPIVNNNLPSRYAAEVTPVIRILIFLMFLILAPAALWIAGLISERWERADAIYQFAKFAAVGTLNSFIDIGVLNLETELYGTSLISNGLFAIFKAISFLFATTNSFIWNKYWTFGANDKTNAKEVTGFYSVALVGWALNVGAATIVKSLGPVGSTAWVTIVAPLAGIAASFAWNFIGYRSWVFKKHA